MARSGTGRRSKRDAALPDIPDKLYFRIGEVARLLDLPAYVLRFWETEFPHLKPNKGGTGQRLYRRRDVDALLVIRRLLYDEGYTIAGARQWLKEKAVAPPPAPPDTALPSRTAEAGGSSVALRHIHAELREIAQLLERPAPPVAQVTHRGLHLAGRRRPVRQMPPLLFPRAPEDDPG